MAYLKIITKRNAAIALIKGTRPKIFRRWRISYVLIFAALTFFCYQMYIARHAFLHFTSQSATLRTATLKHSDTFGIHWPIFNFSDVSNVTTEGTRDRWDGVIAKFANYKNPPTIAEPIAIPEALNFACWPSYRVYSNVYDKSVNTSALQPHKVTIFTQSSLDRFHLLKNLSLSWGKGAISIAIYLETVSDMVALEAHLEDFSKFRQDTQNVSIAAVIVSLLLSAPLSEHLAHLENKNLPQKTYWTRYDLLYPINALRNLALREVDTEWSLSLDLDFVMSANSHSYLTKHLDSWSKLPVAEDKTLFVIPAFEFSSPRQSLLSAAELKKRVLAEKDLAEGPKMSKFYEWCREGLLIPFHSKRFANIGEHNQKLVDAYCQGANVTAPHFRTTKVQALTNFTHWILASSARILRTPVTNETAVARLNIKKQPYVLPIGRKHFSNGSKPSVEWLLANWASLEKHFEPYWVCKTQLVPTFDERFRGYSFNKRQHTIALQRAQFRFLVTPSIMVIHRPHDKSDSKQQLATDRSIQRAIKRVFQKFLTEI